MPGRGTPVGDLVGRLRLTEELTVGGDFQGSAPLIVAALVTTPRVFGHRRSTQSERNSRLRCGVSLTIGWSGRGWDKVPRTCAVPRATQPKR